MIVFAPNCSAVLHDRFQLLQRCGLLTSSTGTLQFTDLHGDDCLKLAADPVQMASHVCMVR